METLFLAPFVSTGVATRLQRSPLAETEAAPFVGALLVADLSGYSRLADVLTHEGSEGTERLTHTLNRSLTPVVNAVHTFGGDVAKFAGDALICVWRVPTEGNATTTEARLRLACAAAVGCARKLLAEFDVYVETNTNPDVLASPKKQNLPARRGSTLLRLSAANSSSNALLSNLTGEPEFVDSMLLLHCGVGAGKLADVFCCGANDRWEHFVGGSAVFSEVSRAVDAAAPGQLVITDYVEALLGSLCDSTPVESQTGLHLVVSASSDGLETSAMQTPVDVVHQTHDQEQMCMSLSMFVPKLITQRAKAGHHDWISELRQCSIIFLNCPHIDVGSDTALTEVQFVLGVVQDAIHEFEGTLRQVLLDDKGFVVIIVFGLPPDVHRNDPARALACSMVIHARLADEAGLSAGIGCTTGRVYCGIVGSEARKEFVVVGDAVNMAARLMLRSDGVLCDQLTSDLAKGSVQTTELEAIKVKGKSQLVRVFRPIVDLGRPGFMSLSESQFVEKIEPSDFHVVLPTCVGHSVLKDCFARIARQLNGIMSNLGASSQTSTGRDCPGCILIEGPAGSGKSTVVKYASTLLRSEAISAIVAPCRDRYRAVPLYSWRLVLMQILGVGRHSQYDIEQRIVTLLTQGTGGGDSSRASFFSATRSKRSRSRATLNEGDDNPGNDHDDDRSSTLYHSGHLPDTQRVGASVRLKPHAPKPRLDVSLMAALLNGFLPGLDIPESSLVKAMDERARNERLVAVIKHLFAMLIRDTPQPTVVIFDSVHSMDSMSWKLLVDVARMRLPRLTIVTTTRPGHELAATYERRLLKIPHVQKHVLDPLSDAETSALVRHVLDVDTVDGQIINLIMEKSGGNPMFVVELTNYLSSSGAVDVTDHRAVPRTDSALETAHMPSSLETVLSQRIDALSVSAQLVLKVAAVIGAEFEAQIVRLVFPVADERAAVESLLAECVGKELLVEVEGQDSGATHAFVNVLARDVCYQMMLPSQRKQLHGKIADQLVLKKSTVAQHEVLARHYLEAERREQAMFYFSGGAEYSIASGAYVEAVRQIDVALTLSEEPDLAEFVSSTQRAEWLQLKGDALFARGDYDQSREALLESLAWASHPAPGLHQSPKTRVMIEAVRQGLHRLFPSAYLARGVDEHEVDQIRWVVSAHEQLQRCNILLSDAPRTLCHALLGLNLSEQRLPFPGPEVVQMYSLAASMLIGMGWSSAAASYHRMAEAAGASVDLSSVTPALAVPKGVYHFLTEDHDVADEWLLMGRDAAREHSQVGFETEINMLLLLTRVVLGRIDSAIDVTNSLMMEAESSMSSPVTQMWAAFGGSLLHLRFGDAVFGEDQVRERMEPALLAFDQYDEVSPMLQLFTIACCGALTGTKAELIKAMTVFQRQVFAPVGMHLGAMVAIVGMLRTIRVAQRNGTDRRTETRGLVRAMSSTLDCDSMRQCARSSVLVQAQIQRMRSYLAWIMGDNRSRADRLRRASRLAARAGSPYEAALVALDMVKAGMADESDQALAPLAEAGVLEELRDVEVVL